MKITPETLNTETATQYIKESNIPFFDTPFFQSHFRSQISAFQLEDNKYIKLIILARLISIAESIRQIHKVWNDVPNDYYQTYLKFLSSFMDLKFFDKDDIVNWTRENVSYMSFFNMVTRYLEKTDLSTTNSKLRDTFNQLEKIMLRGFTVDRPDRWRLDEFHDKVSEVYLEKTTENIPFPFKSISEPYREGNYTVYQPDDTLTLSKWAAKVRNCVASYSDYVFRKQSEIVFVEEKGTPKFTIEIDYAPLKKGSVIIKQIQGSCKPMGQTQEEERKLCQKMIERAVGLF